jgi:hypothetical protein
MWVRRRWSWRIGRSLRSDGARNSRQDELN